MRMERTSFDRAGEEAHRQSQMEDEVRADLVEEFGAENVGECVDEVRIDDEPGYAREALVFLVRCEKRPRDARGSMGAIDLEDGHWWEVAR